MKDIKLRQELMKAGLMGFSEGRAFNNPIDMSGDISKALRDLKKGAIVEYKTGEKYKDRQGREHSVYETIPVPEAILAIADHLGISFKVQEKKVTVIEGKRDEHEQFRG